MSRRVLFKTCILLAVTTQATAQYIDFFQSFNTFLQPFVTPKPKHDVTKRPDTKHRQSNKHKYQDAIFFETDDFLKQKENSRTVDPFNLHPTTTKPRRKSTKTTTTSHSYNAYTTQNPDLGKPNKSENINKIINSNRNVNRELIRSISNNNVNNKVVDNPRRIDNHNGYNDNGYNNYGQNNGATNNNYGYIETNYNTNSNNRQTTQRTTTNNYNYNTKPTTRKTTIDYYNNPRPTTRKTTTDYYNNLRPTTRRTTDYYNNGRQTTRFYENERTTHRSSNNRGTTTSNPLLNRPGVKPAAVDENKPPITNRPITSRPVYDRPFNTGSYKPANTRPPYETERPRPPVNTRPPFDAERPISTGIARPVISEVRPGTSGVRPDNSGGNRPAVSEAGNEDAEPNIEIGPDEDAMSDSEKRRLYDVCEQKCDEYKSGRVKKVVALPLSPNSQGVEVNVSSCAPITNPLIIGGEVVKIEQFPHMALVGWKKLQSSGYSWKCGGSLVSDQYILTAGHCTYHDKDYNVVSGPPHAVQLGSSIYNDRQATVVQISVVIRHPKYKLRRSYYDVALIKLSTTVSFSEKISPACLGIPPPVGDPVIATGWGKTEYGGDSSIELRSVSIPVWDMTDCREIWGTSLKLPNGPMPDNQICAGERKGAKDTCQGDSGGPAQVQDGCVWRVVAVTSVGRSCGAPETPALYARIPRAFIAAQVFTNVKPGRDGNNQYGNEGINENNRGNVNNNRGNENNNRGNENNNRGYENNNGGTGFSNSGNNYNSGIVNNNNRANGDHNGNRGETNVRPIQNNNGQNYDNGGRVQNNNGQYYGNGQGMSNNNRGVTTSNNNNRNNYGTTEHNERPGTTNNNRYNSNNANNNNQNNRNVYDQSSYNNNGQTQRTTTTVGYNNQNYNNGQNNYNNGNSGQYGYNEQYQNIRNTDVPAIIGNYGIQNFGYKGNGNQNNRDNGYDRYVIANRPWWV